MSSLTVASGSMGLLPQGALRCSIEGSSALVTTPMAMRSR
jgi:hypothetical protein